MQQNYQTGVEEFKNHVSLKFQLYNSLFTSLPFHRIEKTGILLSLFASNCEDGYKKNWSPTQIVDDFFSRAVTLNSEQEKNDLLFRIVQYVERQVVLFDSLEDAAFKDVHDLQGAGTVKYLQAEVQQRNLEEELVEKLKNFSIHIVLTAHPTQFYPGTVLGIINDLAKAVKENNTLAINSYLNYDATKNLGFTLRPEYFDDKSGISGAALHAQVFATTLTGQIKLGALTVMPELRIDQASAPVFLNREGHAIEQTTTALMAAVYKF